MDYSINKNFENKCMSIIKENILSLAEGIDGKIFLFGSRVSGNIRRGSDIDIGVDNMDKVSFRRMKIYFDLFLEESFVPYHVDFVNFDEVDSGFRKNALKEVVIWKKG